MIRRLRIQSIGRQAAGCVLVLVTGVCAGAGVARADGDLVRQRGPIVQPPTQIYQGAPARGPGDIIPIPPQPIPPRGPRTPPQESPLQGSLNTEVSGVWYEELLGLWLRLRLVH